MSKSISILVCGFVLSGCVSNGAQGVAGSGDATETAEAEAPKKRCKRIKSTHSRIGERVCTSD